MSRELIKSEWGENILAIIDNQDKVNMTMKDFVSKHCTQCGGNWGGMLLTGINNLWPKVYDAIPNDMGIFAFSCICSVCELLGIINEEE